MLALLLATTLQLNCRDSATLPLGGTERVITLKEAERIGATVTAYLKKEKPELPPPDPAFIDCEGGVRIGAWILEQSYSGKRELRLTYRVVWNEHVIVREEVRLVPVKSGWKVVGVDRVTYHARR
jgi:hypothetical protein